ncbi:GAF and ANTAR domain-containing protein [Gordonia amicalis]|uniref:GAF and ANTAR domain-containing protein n=1 Tax=Gordonia amicalis TaxID=89053 RepID=A0AAE4R634_9ACTN|nr:MULTISPECIES: GAF and ANTAR domain-containing protein [Gordonia]MCZ4580368.1 GAF and ANTAR domain-containing protein [Gordonia amicalis]MDV6307693.1 GAF and ANTAR domain-containing protein [Gordonia amicalis]MDV6312522.1 GAF and ANTAR domain-containing protein [Gordonia amicalis]UKO92451.1 GAF and ANTAR domain-containing protein [Gordonia amicalis]UPW12669.1 GAF and ANTAR domain-containing protein [Gordonia amicalis]
MTELADFGAQMTRIAGEMRKQSDDTETAVRAMTKYAVDAIPGAEYASVTLVSGGVIETPVIVGDLGGEADDLQRRLGEGPCIRAAIDDVTVWIDDLHTDERWPRFAAAAADIGIRSMACFFLYMDGDDFGALNLHSTRPHAFTSEARLLGELFAAHAATAFGAIQEKQQLRAALSSRDIIGQAKGMIMERYKLDANEAFALLARLSQDTNTKLVDVAAQIVVAGPETS